MLDGLANYLKNRFGEVAAIKFGLWTSLILVVITAGVFVFKETASLYEKYYEYKLRICGDAALTVAQIANVRDSTRLQLALERFDELYYGHLILFESPELAKRMVEFRRLFAPQDAELDMAKVVKVRDEQPTFVRQQALKLSSECRAAVRPSISALIWDRIFPVRQ